MFEKTAAETAARVMQLLTDPVMTREKSAGWDLEGNPFNEMGFPAWEPLTLDRGLAGLAVMFHMSGSQDPHRIHHAHSYLAEMVRECKGRKQTIGGLYFGVGALAFATSLAYEVTGGYKQALGSLDNKVRTEVGVMMGLSTPGQPAHYMGEYDVISGLTGLGRYLLARGGDCLPALQRVLVHLAGLARPISHAGQSVPGLWVEGAPVRDTGPLPEYEQGHLNLGLAHGIAGPLALLSAAWASGVRVEGHQEAIDEIATLLIRWRAKDAQGFYWPTAVTIDDWEAGTLLNTKRQRPGWCYGTPGVARALQLAGLALDRPEWCDVARDSLLSQLAIPYAEWGVVDSGLCHGWAGNLIILQTVNADMQDERITRAIDDIAGIIVADYSEECAFGFRSPVRLGLGRGGRTDGFADYPGLLTGAAGIVLALEAYANPRTNRSWVRSLLLA
ncbi:lanthionine synthetase C family protein [Streptomyces sp. NPDC015232]|uniref:lanthionine synthetase C family protein n=1 Tax=unclassified Streptomyces TaxID=2593676 RepID=UPI0036FE7BA9